MIRAVSFLMLSRFDARNSLLNQVIYAAMILLSFSVLRRHHSEPYNSIRTTKVSYSFTLVVFEMLFAFHRLLNLFTIADVIIIL